MLLGRQGRIGDVQASASVLHNAQQLNEYYANDPLAQQEVEEMRNATQTEGRELHHPAVANAGNHHNNSNAPISTPRRPYEDEVMDAFAALSPTSKSYKMLLAQIEHQSKITENSKYIAESNMHIANAAMANRDIELSKLPVEDKKLMNIHKKNEAKIIDARKQTLQGTFQVQRLKIKEQSYVDTTRISEENATKRKADENMTKVRILEMKLGCKKIHANTTAVPNTTTNFDTTAVPNTTTNLDTNTNPDTTNLDTTTVPDTTTNFDTNVNPDTTNFDTTTVPDTTNLDISVDSDSSMQQNKLFPNMETVTVLKNAKEVARYYMNLVLERDESCDVSVNMKRLGWEIMTWFVLERKKIYFKQSDLIITASLDIKDIEFSAPLWGAVCQSILIEELQFNSKHVLPELNSKNPTLSDITHLRMVNNNRLCPIDLNINSSSPNIDAWLHKLDLNDIKFGLSPDWDKDWREVMRNLVNVDLSDY